jgi:hypothetical protein
MQVIVAGQVTGRGHLGLSESMLLLHFTAALDRTFKAMAGILQAPPHLGYRR